MSWLNCTDFDSALSSIATAFGTGTDELREALLSCDVLHPAHASQDPLRQMPLDIAQMFEVSFKDRLFDGVLYFHGTRLVDPTAIERDGVLCLADAIARIWTELFELVPLSWNSERWVHFREWMETGTGSASSHYRTKIGSTLHHGPFGYLVRDVLLKARDLGQHDYLSCPEIVQDIANGFRSCSGIDLEQSFCKASQAVIVTVRMREVSPSSSRRSLSAA